MKPLAYLVALFVASLAFAGIAPAQIEPAKPVPVAPAPEQPKPEVEKAVPMERAIPAIPMMPLMRAGGGAATKGESEAELLVRACEKAEEVFFANMRKARADNIEFDTEKNFPKQFYQPLLRRLADTGDCAALLWCVQNAEWMPPVRTGEENSHAAARAQFRSDLDKLLVSKDDKHLGSAAQCVIGHAGSALSEAEALAYCEKVLTLDAAPKARVLASMASWSADNPGEEYAKQAGQLYDRALLANPDEKLVARINGALFSLRNLREGQPAPALEGVDLAGMPVKLADYKGRVVFLEFWGFW